MLFLMVLVPVHDRFLFILLWNASRTFCQRTFAKRTFCPKNLHVQYVIHNVWFAMCDSQCVIRNVWFIIWDSQFEIHNLRFTIWDSQSEIRNLRFAICDSQFVISNLWFAICDSQFVNRNLWFTIWPCHNQHWNRPIWKNAYQLKSNCSHFFRQFIVYDIW